MKKIVAIALLFVAISSDAVAPKNILEAMRDFEFVHVIEGLGRFRCSIMYKTPGIDLTIRLIPDKLFTFEETGMPDICLDLLNWSQGMVLITGPIGCGKSTTLAVLCEHINQTRNEHIISIEHPVEIVYTPKTSQITQREIGVHTLSQDNAMRAALRQDPDILLISDLRDLSTIQLAATAAETGHLVLGTMNTNDAAQTLLRIINSFPPQDRLSFCFLGDGHFAVLIRSACRTDSVRHPFGAA